MTQKCHLNNVEKVVWKRLDNKLLNTCFAV